jgi:(p)ppGpp synthase/HD superfamily hydrolase
MPSANSSDSLLTSRFEDAFVYSMRLHAKQTRKGSKTPYIAHLLGVTAMVLENGGNEDEAIAALLHDAVEDQGGLETLEEIRGRFGKRVAEIVDAVTDAYTIPKPPWRERKEQYIASIPTASPSAVRVSLADKVYNAQATLRDIRGEGESAWKRFNCGKEGILWYYHQLVHAFKDHGRNYLLEELERLVDEIDRLAGSAYPGDR